MKVYFISVVQFKESEAAAGNVSARGDGGITPWIFWLTYKGRMKAWKSARDFQGLRLEVGYIISTHIPLSRTY